MESDHCNNYLIAQCLLKAFYYTEDLNYLLSKIKILLQLDGNLVMMIINKLQFTHLVYTDIQLKGIDLRHDPIKKGKREVKYCRLFSLGQC